MAFSKRDLALLLPDVQGDAASMRHTEDDTGQNELQALKPKVDHSKKVQIYRAGQVPTWAQEEEEEFGDDVIKEAPKEEDLDEEGMRRARARARARAREIAQAQVIEGGSASEEEEEEEEDIGKAGETSPVEGDVDWQEKEELVEAEENDDAIAQRRARIRQKLKAKREEEEAELEGQADQEEAAGPESSSESSEWETDTDDSDVEQQRLLKPVFVPKAKRETILEQELLEAARLEAQGRFKAEMEERKKESRTLVAEEVRRDQEQSEKVLDGVDSDLEMPNDDDEIDEEKEYEDWKVRELQRVKRDQEEREKILKEAAEVERRRKLTPEARKAEDEARRAKEGKLKKEKPKIGFMQKYYHKGAFYMDDDTLAKDKNDVRTRDYMEPTGEDKFNKEAMPKVMQVKNFGRSGQTRWTHLTNEDTTKFDAAWADKNMVRKSKIRAAGTGDIDAAFRKRTKR